MQTIKKILVVIDPDKPEQPALTKALLFAKQQPITIKLLSCLYYPSVMASNFLSTKQLEKTQSEIINTNQVKLNNLIDQNTQKHVTFETEVMWHWPVYQGILKVVTSFQPDLVIKATHPHKTIAKRFFTPTDWYLLKACPVPVLLVKNREWTENTTIVAAIDPEHNLSAKSELDRNILKTGYVASSALTMQLQAIHCFDPSYWDILLEAVDKSGMWADVFSFDQEQNESMVLEKLRYQHNLKFAKECSEFVPNSENQHIISGDIEEVMPKTLGQLRAGILVLGTTYRTGLLGSTAQKLIETVDCDLLAVKPTGFEAPFH
ncbi:universal stress protein [Paraglaciecola arctica]|uniref:universal stress protein n=1 Tax=Paraglaciecola arctica TaxID=1128911 RepID=UPI001C070382|nr:universal stress protein [Paraglaciecola arctica]MBU3006078.1 universal stress protein [Paraglaciecola arctica]